MRGSIFFCLIQQGRLFLGDASGGEDLDAAGFVVGVFQQPDAEENPAGREAGSAEGRDVAGHPVHPQVVAHLRSPLFADADGDHLHQAAFVCPPERWMRLDPIDQNNGISHCGVGVQPVGEGRCPP